MESAWVESHRIIHEVIQVLGVKAREKGITLEFKAESALPQQIETDPARLRQIIFNLVGNAIKFTEKGAVKVACRFENTAAGSQLLIDIIDTGIGIAAEKVESVFDPFTQADSAVTRRFGGTGLGLSISRKFARALGGDISVKSQPGLGSTFRVSLATGDLTEVPFLQPEEIETTAQSSADAQPSHWQFPEARILVVDDGEENRELLRLFLEAAGLTVDEAENGSIAVTKALRDPYDVILMDVNMPVMDGFTATGKLRQQGLKTPIIALTANAMKGFEQACLDAGYSGYSSKPIDIDRFMQQMADLLGGRSLEGQTATATDGASNHTVKVPQAAEVSPIISKLPSTNTRFRSLIARFIERLNEQLQAVEQAFVQGKYDDIAAFAHWLKGAGGTVGFDDFTTPAGRLETLSKTGGDDVDIREAIDDLRQLAARLVVAESESPATSMPEVTSRLETASKAPSNIHRSLPELGKPLTSRLAVNPRFHKIIYQFSDKLKAELRRAEGVLAQANGAELALIAHWLKGAGGTVGFDDFTTPAAKLEAFAKAGQLEQAGQVLQRLKVMSEAIVPPTSVQEDAVIEKSTKTKQAFAVS
jgi:CheY-like chemotaxis protein